jgi:hypothetical protein
MTDLNDGLHHEFESGKPKCNRRPFKGKGFAYIAPKSILPKAVPLIMIPKQCVAKNINNEVTIDPN